MTHATDSSITCGEVVMLRDGRLGITVYPLADGRILILTDGNLCAVSLSDIRQRPAACSGCTGKLYWWDDGHFIPWCVACIPPDGEWRTETLHAASAFVERTGSLLPRWFMSWLTAQEHIGPGGWAIAQQFAFVDRAAGLVCQWLESEGLWE